MKNTILLVAKDSVPTKGRNYEYEVLQQKSCKETNISFIYGDIIASPESVSSNMGGVLLMPTKEAKYCIEERVNVIPCNKKLDISKGYWIGTGNKILGSVMLEEKEYDCILCYKITDINKLDKERRFNRMAVSEHYQEEIIFISNESLFCEPVTDESKPMKSGKTLSPGDIKESMYPFYAIESEYTRLYRADNVVYEAMGYKLSDILIRDDIQRVSLPFAERYNNNWRLITEINQLAAGKYTCRTREGYYVPGQKSNNQFELEIKEMRDYNPVSYYSSFKRYLADVLCSEGKEFDYDNTKETFYKFIENNWYVGDIEDLFDIIRKEKDYVALATIKAASEIFEKSNRDIQSTIYDKTYTEENIRKALKGSGFEDETLLERENGKAIEYNSLEKFYPASIIKLDAGNGITQIVGVLK